MALEDRLLKQAQKGVDRSPIMMRMNGRDVKIGEKRKTSVQPKDITSAMIQDRDAAMKAAEDQRRRDQRARRDVIGAHQQAAQGARQAGERFATNMEQAVQPFGQQTEADIGEIQRRSRYLTKQSEGYRAEAMADVDQRKTEALQSYDSDVAASIQNTRMATQANLQSQRQQILDQAAASGMSPNDPAVQQQLQQANMAASQQLGQQAIQASLQYNQNVASLRNNYDQMSVARRQAADAGAQRGAEQTVSGLIDAQKLRQQSDRFLMDYKRVAEAGRLNTQLTADQLELSGNVQGAQMLRDMVASFSPIAPILAAAMSLQQSQIDSEVGAFAAQGRIGGGQPNFDPFSRPQAGSPSSPSEPMTIDQRRAAEDAARTARREANYGPNAFNRPGPAPIDPASQTWDYPGMTDPNEQKWWSSKRWNSTPAGEENPNG